MQGCSVELQVQVSSSPARPLLASPPGRCSAALTFCLPQQAAQFVESLDLLGLGYHEPVAVHDDRVVTARKGPSPSRAASSLCRNLYG